jgi:hypothetical protein
MPISVLLAAGTNAASSVDIALADGSSATLILRGIGKVLVEAKNSVGGYASIGEIVSDSPVQQLYGPMTFRARREDVVPAWAPAGQTAVAEPVGVDVDKA